MTQLIQTYVFMSSIIMVSIICSVAYKNYKNELPTDPLTICYQTWNDNLQDWVETCTNDLYLQQFDKEKEVISEPEVIQIDDYNLHEHLIFHEKFINPRTMLVFCDDKNYYHCDNFKTDNTTTIFGELVHEAQMKVGYVAITDKSERLQKKFSINTLYYQTQLRLKPIFIMIDSQKWYWFEQSYSSLPQISSDENDLLRDLNFITDLRNFMFSHQEFTWSKNKGLLFPTKSIDELYCSKQYGLLFLSVFIDLGKEYKPIPLTPYEIEYINQIFGMISLTIFGIFCIALQCYYLKEEREADLQQELEKTTNKKDAFKEKCKRKSEAGQLKLRESREKRRQENLAIISWLKASGQKTDKFQQEQKKRQAKQKKYQKKVEKEKKEKQEAQKQNACELQLSNKANKTINDQKNQDQFVSRAERRQKIKEKKDQVKLARRNIRNEIKRIKSLGQSGNEIKKSNTNQAKISDSKPRLLLPARTSTTTYNCE